MLKKTGDSGNDRFFIIHYLLFIPVLILLVDVGNHGFFQFISAHPADL